MFIFEFSAPSSEVTNIGTVGSKTFFAGAEDKGVSLHTHTLDYYKISDESQSIPNYQLSRHFNKLFFIFFRSNGVRQRHFVRTMG